MSVLKRALEDVILAMVPQKRLLPLSEIADYAIFLASDKGSRQLQVKPSF